MICGDQYARKLVRAVRVVYKTPIYIEGRARGVHEGGGTLTDALVHAVQLLAVFFALVELVQHLEACAPRDYKGL